MFVETLGRLLPPAGACICAVPSPGATESARRSLFRCELDVETLVCTRGRAFPLTHAARAAAVPAYGSREVAVVFDPQAPRGGLQSDNAPRKAMWNAALSPTNGAHIAERENTAARDQDRARSARHTAQFSKPAVKLSSCKRVCRIWHQ